MLESIFRVEVLGSDEEVILSMFELVILKESTGPGLNWSHVQKTFQIRVLLGVPKGLLDSLCQKFLESN